MPKKKSSARAPTRPDEATRKSSAKATTTPAKEPRVSRRDGAGHLDPAYAAELRAKSLASAEVHTAERAFLPGSGALRASLAEELGREAVMTMTSGEDQSDQLQDVELELEEEIGGPFVPTSARQELARGYDPSNPRGATREPFPTT
jgi:hypothetical protein